jgi:cysteine synthase
LRLSLLRRLLAAAAAVAATAAAGAFRILIPVRACLVGPVGAAAAAAADQVQAAMDVPMVHRRSTGSVLTAMNVPMGHRAAAWAFRAL